MELKPNGASARSAAKKTASVSGLKTLAYRCVHPGGDKFTFVYCTSEGKGVSRGEGCQEGLSQDPQCLSLLCATGASGQSIGLKDEER